MVSFEKIGVWQKASTLSTIIYKTTKHFPEDERLGLMSQMYRCSILISSNIVQGIGRHSDKDKAPFTEIASLKINT